MAEAAAYAACEGSGGATATAGGLVFHVEPDGVFQAYDAKTGDVLWQFQTGEVGLRRRRRARRRLGDDLRERRPAVRRARPNNRAVWAFKLGGTVAAPARAAAAAHVDRVGWTGRRRRRPITLGTVRTSTSLSANKKMTWADDYGLAPVARAHEGRHASLTFKNTSTKPHTIAARDGSWTTGAIQPGESGTATVTKAGTYEYICTEHPWTIGQLIVE